MGDRFKLLPITISVTFYDATNICLKVYLNRWLIKKVPIYLSLC